MKQFWRNNGILILIIAVLMTGVTMTLSFVFTGNANPLANALGIVATPARAAGASVGGWIEGLYADAFERDRLKDEVERLRLELSEMERLAQEGQAALRENERLRAFIGLREARRDFVFESATVTARSASNWESLLTVSKGTMHGVAVGQCVTDATGYFVGVVSEVGLNWASVRTIVDTGIELGGMIARTDSTAILQGDFILMGEGRLKLTYLPEGAEIMAGDLILSSGKGGVYPFGLTVGTIESLHTDPSGMSRYAVVAPKTDLSELSQVFIIKEFDIVE